MSLFVNNAVCPVCKNSEIKTVLQATDHTVSKETFSIVECSNCSFRFTSEAPVESEIHKYYQSSAYISHSNTKKGIINLLYHWARYFTMMSKESLVKKESKRQVGMLLDIGSGTGTFVHTMDRAGWSVVGLEPDEDARAFAIKQYKVDVYPSEHLFRLPEGTYSAITMWHVLEHVHQLDAYVQRIKELLAPKGKLIVAVPNYTSKDAEVYGAYWASYDVPRHLYHFSPKSMDVLMKRHGLRVIKKRRMWLDSYYVSMLSEKYKKGNFIKALWNGFASNLSALMNKERCSSLVYVIEKAD
jgi:2-polyprenyl-3-methyl-5-hydroxy-6-metoxy-1,4-benzoquinol methylase